MPPVVRPDFQILGTQKSGTTWLWEMLRQHPDIAVPSVKECYFFCSSREYHKGKATYYRQFEGLDSSKVVGETSTGYFYDKVLIDNLEVDASLPSIPALVTGELPGIKVIVLLRDPVRRAISAYYHHMAYRRFSPYMSLREADNRNPSFRIVELGRYARFLRAWKQHVPEDHMRVYVFEEDVVHHPDRTIQDAYRFLGVGDSFQPQRPSQARNQGWGWTHIVLSFYLGFPYATFYRVGRRTPLGRLLKRVDILKRPPLKQSDIQYLREAYLPEREELEDLLGRKLDCWKYRP